MEPATENPRYASLMLEGLKEAGVSIVTALPDSLLRSFYRMVAEEAGIRYIRVSNEADMPGIVAGAYLGGKKAVMVMENSGIRQACLPLSGLAFGRGMPMVMFMPYRGDVGEDNWWGHTHAQTMEPLLNAMRIPYRIVRQLDEIKPNIKRAFRHAEASQWPIALIFASECVEVPFYETD